MDNKLSKPIKILLSAILFLLPWQTIWITKENFLNNEKWQYGILGFYATEILLWLCAVLFIIQFIKKKRLQATSYKLQATKDRIFIFSLLLFVLYSLLSSVWAINPDVAYQHGLHIMEAIILFLMLFAGPLNFRQAAIWFVAGAAAQSLLGIYQFLTQSTFTFKWLGLSAHPAWEAGASIISTAEHGRWLRAYGAFPHPNIFGGYLVVSLIFNLLLLAKEKNQNILLITGYWLLVTAQIAALFFTFSRSAWLAFTVFIISYSIYHITYNKKRALIANQSNLLAIGYWLLAIVSILSLLYFPLVQTRFSRQTNNELQSVSERQNGYAEAWKIFRQNPILGVGAGNYTAAAYNLRPHLPGWEYQPVHNVPLLILVELGVVGFALLILVLISFITLAKNQRYWLLVTGYGLLLLFDHYLFSTYTGLTISAIFIALVSKKINPI